jgi:hypothetical protein
VIGVIGQRSEPGLLAVGVLAGFALGLLVAGILVAGRTDTRPTLSTNVTDSPSSSQLALPVIETVTSMPAPTVTSTVTVTSSPQPPTALPVATPPPSASRIIAPSRPPIWP